MSGLQGSAAKGLRVEVLGCMVAVSLARLPYNSHCSEPDSERSRVKTAKPSESNTVSLNSRKPEAHKSAKIVEPATNFNCTSLRNHFNGILDFLGFWATRNPAESVLQQCGLRVSEGRG